MSSTSKLFKVLKYCVPFGYRCDGQANCTVPSNNQLGDPCHGTYKYTQVTFKCSDPCSLCDPKTKGCCKNGGVVKCYDLALESCCDFGVCPGL